MNEENSFTDAVDDNNEYLVNPLSTSNLSYLNKYKAEQSDEPSGIDWDEVISQCNEQEAEQIAKMTPFEKYQYESLGSDETHIESTEEYTQPLRFYWCGLTLLPKPHNSLFINFDKDFVAELKKLSREYNNGQPFEQIYFYKFFDKLTISPFEPKHLKEDIIVKSNTIQYAGRDYCQMRVPILTYFRKEFNTDEFTKVGLLAEWGEGHYRCDFTSKRKPYKEAWGFC